MRTFSGLTSRLSQGCTANELCDEILLGLVRVTYIVDLNDVRMA
jgi:hypothetical protein